MAMAQASPMHCLGAGPVIHRRECSFLQVDRPFLVVPTKRRASGRIHRSRMQLTVYRKVAMGSSENGKRMVELPRHVERVSSSGNPYVKHLVKVRESSSYREGAGSVVIVGSTPLREICEFAVTKSTVPFELEVLLLLEDSPIPEDLSTCSQRIVYLTEPVMRKIAGVKSPEAIDAIGVLQLPPTFCKLTSNEDPAILQQWCPQPQRLLILDGIQDPGNLGTLLRTAAAFSWDGIYLLPGCCDPFNEKAMRAARGANFRMPIAVGSWRQVQVFAKSNSMKFYAGNPEQVHSSVASKKSYESVIQEIKTENALCLVLGSEGQGLSDAAKRACRQLAIPMPGHFESLNVAVVGGIFMYLLMKK